jgi:hypothetical protein
VSVRRRRFANVRQKRAAHRTGDAVRGRHQRRLGVISVPVVVYLFGGVAGSGSAFFVAFFLKDAFT